MLKYSALIYPEKPDPDTGRARKRIYFPELVYSQIAFVVNHDSKEKMVMWALLRAIDSLILDRRIVSLGRREQDAAEVDVTTELDWTCKLKILVSNWLIKSYPSHNFNQISEDLEIRIGNLYSAGALVSILSVRKKSSVYDVEQLLVMAGQLQIPIKFEAVKLTIE